MSDAPTVPGARWVAVLDESRIGCGRSVAVRVDGWPVVLARGPAGLHALSGICPHDHAGLGGGEVRDGMLFCPRHRACFALTTGACVSGFTLPALARYPVRVIEGEVQIDAAAVGRDPPGGARVQRWDLTDR